MKKLGWSYPKSENPLLWACERRYFYCGKLVMEVKGGNIFDNPTVILTDDGNKLVLSPINIDTLRKVNADAMFLIVCYSRYLDRFCDLLS